MEFQFYINSQNGGRKIVPSARKSIHSQNTSNVSPKLTVMVRFGNASGEDSSEDENSGPSSGGTDEVDNNLRYVCISK